MRMMSRTYHGKSEDPEARYRTPLLPGYMHGAGISKPIGKIIELYKIPT
jgi:hypothetical protein